LTSEANFYGETAFEKIDVRPMSIWWRRRPLSHYREKGKMDSLGRTGVVAGMVRMTIGQIYVIFSPERVSFLPPPDRHWSGVYEAYRLLLP
jgi:hypothetical protein